MIKNLLVHPPAAFLILLTVIFFIFILLSRLSFRRKEAQKEGAKKAYACGEEFDGHLIQPDYSRFFPFAFFFTLLHVVALVIATVPTETIETFAIAIVYVIGAIVCLFILLSEVKYE